jgi:hypothetical protein
MENQQASLSDQELKEALEKAKKTAIYDALFIGLLIGVAAYSTFSNGFGLLTFLPIVYLPIAGKNKKKRTELENQIKERGL